jgi:hypothetical protein
MQLHFEGDSKKRFREVAASIPERARRSVVAPELYAL